jgi:hypothetical protein
MSDSDSENEFNDKTLFKVSSKSGWDQIKTLNHVKLKPLANSLDQTISLLKACCNTLVQIAEKDVDKKERSRQARLEVANTRQAIDSLKGQKLSLEELDQADDVTNLQGMIAQLNFKSSQKDEKINELEKQVSYWLRVLNLLSRLLLISKHFGKTKKTT